METIQKLLGKLQIRRLNITVLIALLIGIVVSYEVACFLGNRAKSIGQPRYLMLRHNVPSGHRLGITDLSSGSSSDVAADSITDQELHLLDGAIAVREFKAGSILTWSGVQVSAPVRLGSRVPKGHVAYSFVSSDFLGIAPQDRIDISLKPSQAGDSPVILVEGALVIQVNRMSGQLGIVVAIERQQASLLEKALQRGTLTVALRNPEEEIARPPNEDGSNLFRKRGRKPKVEIWSEAG